MSEAGGTWLLLGPEAGLKDEFVGSLASALEKAAPPLDRYRYYYPEPPLARVIDSLRNGGLFSASTLVELRNAELIRSKEEAEALRGWIADPAPNAVLVLCSEATRAEGELGRLEKELGDRKKIFWEMFESDKRRWVQRRLASRKLRADDGAVDALLELCENTTDELGRECDRIAAFHGEGAAIGAAEVEALVEHGREENAFTLFDRVAEGRLEDALDALRAILLSRSSDAVQLVAGLLYCFRRLRGLAAIVGAGGTAEDAFSEYRMSSKKAREPYERALRRYDLRGAEAAISELARAEAAAKGQGREFEEISLTLLIRRLAVGMPSRRAG